MAPTDLYQNDIKALRAYLQKTATTDPNQKLEVPYSILSVLTPLAVPNSLPQSNVASASVTAALKARVATLQQENDELYAMMSSSVVSKLDEEVKMLRNSVSKLESALLGNVSPLIMVPPRPFSFTNSEKIPSTI